MKRIPYLPDVIPDEAIPLIEVLVPESFGDTESLTQTLEDKDIANGMSACPETVSGTLIFPIPLTWHEDGGVKVGLRPPGSLEDIDVWYWVIEVRSQGRVVLGAMAPDIGQANEQ